MPEGPEGDLPELVRQELEKLGITQGLVARVSMVLNGVGDPNGQIAAPVGSIFQRADGGAATAFYVKESGDTTSSGWAAK